MNNEPNKPENQVKMCEFRHFSQFNPKTGQGLLISIPCPKTSKTNIIMNTSGCPMWSEELAGCKQELSIDYAVRMVKMERGQSIVRPS